VACCGSILIITFGSRPEKKKEKEKTDNTQINLKSTKLG